VDREDIDSWCEKGILGLVLAILVYSPLAFGSVAQAGFDYFLVVEWLTVLILVFWFARFFINPKHRLLWPPVCWAVLLFVGYAIGRYLTSDVEYLARQELLRVLVYSLLFFAIVNNLHRQETTQIVGLTLIFLAMTISLYAVFQFLTSTDYVWSSRFLKPEGYLKRGSGTFMNPNNLAGYLEMVLPLALAFTITGRFEPLQKIFLGYASLAIFTGIAVTVSRGGWLATGISLLVMIGWLLRQRDYYKRALVLIPVLGIIFLAFYWRAEMPPERRERFDVARQIEDVRFRLWQPAWRMWKEHPWFGVGLAHFDYRFRQYRPDDPGLQPRPDRVHNDYLNTLVDWGIVGAVLVLLCWAVFYYQVFTGWKYVQRTQNDLGAKRSNKSAFVSGGALGLLAILVHSLVDFNLHIPANAILAVTLFALVSSHYRFASERYWHTVRLPLRIPVSIALLAALAYLGPQTWKSSAQSYWLRKSDADVASFDSRIAALTNAHRVDHQNFETTYLIAESLREDGFRGAEGYKEVTRQAMQWFEKTMQLNPYDPHGFTGYGMCLDWLGRPAEAADYFKRAQAIDPNGYLTLARSGWHSFQIEDYAAAKKLLERSLGLMPNERFNPIPNSYLKIIAGKLKETAAAR
jgi:O-antigen ligase